MNTYLRTSFIERLMAAIGAVGPRFEAFGGRFMTQFLAVPLNHRGLNVLGHSVGYTVDSFNDGGTTVAEYSAEGRYYSGDAPKPVRDVLHAVHLYPRVIDIFLLSADACGNTEASNFVQRVKEWPGFGHRTVHVYDARRIAESIVDSLLVSDLAVEELSDYLPALKQIRDENAASLLAPTLASGYLGRREVDDVVAARLTQAKSLVITGLAGIGKSQAAASYASSNKDKFELVVWLKGDTLSGIEALHSTELHRGGAEHNVAGLLRMRRCLAVIDDSAVEFEATELEKLCGPDSRVIVTQRRASGHGFTMPLMTEDEARQLLNSGLAQPVPDDVWATIWATVGGHPLSIRLMNAAAHGGATWEDLREDCAVVGKLDDGGHQKLADRLLSRLKGLLRYELGVFTWLGSPVGHRDLLRKLIAPVGVRNLQTHSLAAADQEQSLRIHDVVFAALSADSWLTANEIQRLDLALETYLSDAAQLNGVALRATASLMKEKLRDICRTKGVRPSLLYALMLEWKPYEIDRDLVGDPAALVKSLEVSTRSPTYIETSTAFESIECLLRADKHSAGWEAAKINLEARLPLFGRLAALKDLTPLQLSQIKHHRGKALSLLGRRDEAIQEFQDVLDGRAPLYESQLQLIRLLPKVGRAKDALNHAELVLAAAKRPDEVSTSVVLATIGALPSGAGRDALIEAHAEVAEREILRAANAYMGQAFEALAAAGRNWSWKDPERFRRVWARMPVMRPASDSERFVFGELHQIAAKALPESAAELTASALSIFREMKTLDGFQAQKFGQTLFEAGEFTEALKVLSSITSPTPWSEYWTSKNYLGSLDLAQALKHVDEALRTLPAKQDSYLASFKEHRFDVRDRLGDSSAVDDLKEAVAVCRDSKYKAKLTERLEMYRPATKT